MKWWLLPSCFVFKIAGLWLILGAETIAGGCLLFFLGGVIVLAQIFYPRAQAICPTVSAFTPVRKEVWLTIDDGPCPEDTPMILDLLRQYEAKATFFLIGERVARHPDLVDAILDAGHEIGSHTQTHPVGMFWCSGPSKIASEIDQSLALLNRPGRAISLFRAPVGFKPLFLGAVLRRRGLLTVAWTIRSGDGRLSDPDLVFSRLTKAVRPGAILLMHEGPGVAEGVRVEVIRRSLKFLNGQGYRLIHPDRTRFIY